MSLTKQTVVDQITVAENGVVYYREATRIMEDGKQISQTFHRTVLVPGQSLENQPVNVAAICNAAWTPEIIAAFPGAQAATQT